ncbi:MAG: LamG-like jellyroll fold domain-containing protein [Planctomycetota bacterium]
MKKNKYSLRAPKNGIFQKAFNNQGITLVIILLILTSLIILAIPFAGSMLFKEKSSKDVLQTNQSRFAAIGARNSAINLLLRTHNFYELNTGASAPFNTPDYDTTNEFETNLYQFSQIPSDPKGTIWSAIAEDEQAKINLTTAPRRVVNQLKSLIQTSDDPQHFLTEYSYRSTTWIAAQNLGGYKLYTGKDGRQYHVIYLDNSGPFYNEEGCRVRLQQGNEEFIAYVAFEPCPDCKAVREIPYTINSVPGNHTGWESSSSTPVIWRNLGSQVSVYLDRVVPNNFLDGTTIVEVEQPHPININTASIEVISAVISGVGHKTYNLDGSISDTTISLAEATSLANDIKKTIFTKPLDLENFITNTSIISADQKPDLRTSVLYARDNSLANMVDRKFAGTLPFCFRSFDIYTMNSTGIINRSSGSQAGQTTLNEIVDIAPVGEVITWSIESQYDFDSQFYTFLGNPLKMVTYPNLTNPGTRYYYDTGRDPDCSRTVNNGYLKLRAAEDNRNKSIRIDNSFSDTYDEGVTLPLDYNRDNVFDFYGLADTGKYGIHAGGVEFWIKFNSIPVSRAYFFDTKQSDYENRLAVWYESNNLVLSVCDATVERKASQIRAPVTLEANVWYHIGAYWKEPKYAQLALFLDGRPVGSFSHYDDSDQKILAELTADLPDEANMSQAATQITISVNSTTGFPTAGSIEIGEEIIAYNSIESNGFVVSTTWGGGVLDRKKTGRGWSGSQIVDHPAGSKVTIHGYSTAFVPTIQIIGYPDINLNPLPIGGARLLGSIPSENPQIELGGYISDIDTTIILSSTTNMASKGYVRIDNEVIYYGSVVLGEPGQISDCNRGQLGTVRAEHFGLPLNVTPVIIFSVLVDNNTNYPSPVIIQIDDEWIGPLQTLDSEFFTGIVSGGSPLDIIRGWVSDPKSHTDTTAPIIPVLATVLTGTAKNDVVTIIETDQTTNPKEEKTIRNSWTDGSSNLFAFTSNLNRSYTVDNITRILKFPSDELPSYLPASFTVGSGLDATIDEIKFLSGEKGYYVTEEILRSSDAGKTAVQFNGASLDTSGIVKVGDEYIGYATINAGTSLTNCKRGYLNSSVLTHDKKQRAFNLSALLPVSALTTDISAEGSVISITNVNGFAANGGYLLIGNDLNTAEVVGYCNIVNSSFVMPAHSNGIFRGAFGTNEQAHNTNTLCYGIPFRYWDLQKADAFDNQMAYFQAAHYARGATWKKISWNETHTPSNDSLVRLRFLARFNNQPPWNTSPTNQKDGIFEFTDPNGANSINIQADQIEVMVFFQYLPGAFSSNAWKRSPLLENIYVEYDKPVVTLSRQER